MNVREAEAYNTNPATGQRSSAPFTMKMALKAVELYLGTCRAVIVRSRCSEKALQGDSPRKPIIALWHSSLIYTLYHFSVYKGTIMTSPSKDGQWVATVISMWGQIPVRGSRMKGGLKAVKQMAGLMKRFNIPAGIVADGSKGPANIAQIGAVILARETGSPIIPTGFAASRAKYFNTWDRLCLPLPFSRVCLVYGDEFTVPGHARGRMVEFYRKRLEDGLNAATKKAAALAGVNYEGLGQTGQH